MPLQTPPKKLWVTGASGFLGWNVFQAAAAGWELYGTWRSHPITLPNVTLIQADLSDFSTLRRLFQEIQPSAVIHTAAQSSPNLCQTEPEASHRINVLASWQIAELCADADIPCVFTSTDLVFDGLNAPYTEESPVSPISRYGEQKVLAEVGMLERYPKSAICRMPLMFGYAPTANSFLQPFLKALRAGEELSLFTDEFRTPVSGRDAAKGLLLALENVQGRIHLGGKERLSRYDFGQLMVQTLELPQAKLGACRQADVKMAAPRPPDVSLDSARAFSLGYSPASVKDELTALQGIV